MSEKEYNRIQRHRRIRKKIFGTTDRPRLSIYRSHKNLRVQLVDDIASKTVISLSTLDKAFKDKKISGGNRKGAEAMAQLLTDKLRAKKIERIVFDRGGYDFHGRVRVFADKLREQGIKF